MKRILTLLVCLSAVFSMSSCEDFLTQEPKDKLTSAQAFSSEATLQLYINGFYATILPNAATIYSGDVTSDIMVPTVIPDYLLAGNVNANNTSGWTWTNLRNINYLLVNNTNANVPAAVRNHYSGIARFFRAYFYYEMVKRYGDVPWYSTPLDPDSPDLYKAKDSRKMVMDSVLADLNFATTNINLTKDNTCSNVTRYTAMALKSRICLFEGTYRKYHTELNLTDANRWLEESSKASLDLINSGQYSLVTGAPASSYRSLFISETPNNQEVLLASIASNALQKWHASTYWYNSPTTGSRLSLDKHLVNTYLNSDGTRYTDKPGFETATFQQETQNRDRRLEQTIRFANYVRSDGSKGLPNFNVTITGYHTKKFSLDNPYYDSRTESFNSLPIFRYAEVLLNYAEAQAELGQLSDSDWAKTIGALRTRAGITNTARPTSADSYLSTHFYPGVTDATILEVRRERAIELVAEGFRYADLLRWKRGKNLERAYTGMYVPALGTPIDIDQDGAPDVCFVRTTPSTTIPGVVYVTLDGTVNKLSEGTSGNILWNVNRPKTFDDKRYYYPIPFDQIQLNPKIEQNSGW
jgi:hypothetical protein